MILPKWIPYPISWLRTFVLIGITGCTGYALYTLRRFVVLLTAPNTALTIAVFVAIALIPFIFYAYVHSWLLGKTKSHRYSKLLPKPNSIKESLVSLAVMILSFMLTVLVMTPFIPNITSFELERTHDELSALVWLITMLYMFQGYHLFLVSHKKAKSPKIPTTTSNKTRKPNE